MAPLPPESTARFKVFYTNVSHQHTLEVRSAGSPSAVGTFLDSFFTDLGGLIYSTVIDEVQFAANGSNIFNAVVTGIEGNVYTGAGSGTLAFEAAQYLSFIGRSSGGRRCRWYVFGCTVNGGDYRFVSGENAGVDACVADLTGAGSLILAIDGLVPSWKSYANAGANAHWQKAVRP
jgi:hypothetical protein